MASLTAQRKKRMREGIKRLFLILAIISIYFLGVRSIRGWVHDQYLGTLLPAEFGVINDDVQFTSQSSVSFSFYKVDELHKSYQFRMPFDSYFLFASIGLIVIGGYKKAFLILIALHVGSGVITLFAVWLGVNYFANALIITDFICRYLVPIGSLGLVALTLVEIKNSAKNE